MLNELKYCKKNSSLKMSKVVGTGYRVSYE